MDEKQDGAQTQIKSFILGRVRLPSNPDQIPLASNPGKSSSRFTPPVGKSGLDRSLALPSPTEEYHLLLSLFLPVQKIFLSGANE
jgi:hypothetical protein